MSLFTVGDTAPDLSGRVNVSLVGAGVQLHMRKPDNTAIVRTATIVNEATGTWSYSWITGDLDQEGAWTVNARVTFASTRIQTFGPSPFYVGKNPG